MSADTPVPVDGYDEPEIERYELTGPPRYRFEVARRDFMRIFGLYTAYAERQVRLAVRYSF